MIDYSLFSAVAFFVKNADPDLTHQCFSVEESDCNADWKHILSECSKLEADYLVNDENLIVNVEFDKINKVYLVSYQSVSGRKSEALKFLKKFKWADPVLAESIYDLFIKNSDAQLYEEQKNGRVHYGVKIDDTKVYEGTIKL